MDLVADCRAAPSGDEAALVECQRNAYNRNITAQGMIGFDVCAFLRGSGPRTSRYLVNARGKPIGADSKRTDFALAA